MNLDWTVAWQYRELLAHGVLVTVLLTVFTMVIAVPGGVVVMLLHQSPSRLLRGLGTAYVEFFRNLPLILLVYWAFYVLPMLVDIQLSAFATGLVALCLNVTAYNSETFRAGVNSIRKGQLDAGLALGMSRGQVMRQIVLPAPWPGRRSRPASTPAGAGSSTSCIATPQHSNPTCRPRAPSLPAGP